MLFAKQNKISRLNDGLKQRRRVKSIHIHYLSRVEVWILEFKNTSVEVEVSTQAFYSSRSIKVLASKLLKV